MSQLTLSFFSPMIEAKLKKTCVCRGNMMIIKTVCCLSHARKTEPPNYVENMATEVKVNKANNHPFDRRKFLISNNASEGQRS